MVNMGNDGDIAYRLRHREFFLFCSGPSFIKTKGLWVGGATVANRHTMRQFLFYQQACANWRPARPEAFKPASSQPDCNS
jgi:hypothetical protein